MRVEHLGHVVLYVENLRRSVEFYSDLLGLESYGTIFNGKAAVLTIQARYSKLVCVSYDAKMFLKYYIIR